LAYHTAPSGRVTRFVWDFNKSIEFGDSAARKQDLVNGYN